MERYSRRDFLKTAAATGAGAAGLGFPSILRAQGNGPVKVGVLHSLSGTMAISEVSLRDVVLMAIEEINVKSGVLGRKIEPVVVDPASNWDLFAEKAKQLLLQDKVAVVFGCWTSVSRKSVLPVFENNNGLLFYPVQYEGEECSRNVFYTGATPNQQLIPAAEYLMSKEGGGYKKFYLLGTDYVFPRTANKILRAFLLAKGIPGDSIAEEYTPFNHQDYQTIVGKIKRFASGGNAAVLSTINGDSNVPFYREFANQGLRSENAPIMAFSVAEDELRGMDTAALVGHLAAWNYYQSVDTPQNKKFVQAFRAYCKKNNLPGGDKRVTDDPIEAAYFGVHMWKQAVEKAKSVEVDAVRKAVYGQEFGAPGGKVKMHEVNHHTYKPVLIGEILKDGQFKVVWKTKGLVERWRMAASAVEIVFQGLSLSSILLLMALGLAIVFGLMGVINMAHGELMALGAYATFVVQGWFAAHLPSYFDYYFLAALPVSVLVAGAAGIALERGVIRLLYGRPLETLLLTWGVSLIVQQGLRLWFGAANVDVSSPRWLSGGIPVMAGVQLPYNRLFIIGLAAACVSGMYWLLFRTEAGLRIRAVTQNRGMAACLGVRTRWVDAGTFALGAGLAGLAGCALTQIGNVGPELGQNYIVDSFMVVVTGGVGKLVGSILAALGIGGLNKIIEPSFGAVYGKVLILALVILFIQRRPSGLFAAKGRQADA